MELPQIKSYCVICGTTLPIDRREKNCKDCFLFYKLCTKCDIVYPDQSFPKRGINGRQPYCKECHRTMMREYRKANEANRDHINAARREKDRASYSPDKRKAYRDKNADKIKQQQLEWYEQNKEALKREATTKTKKGTQ